MIVVISEPIRQLRDYFDDRWQAIYTDQQTRPALFIVDNKDEMEIEIKVIDLLQGL
jgi:hypothetical protein